MTVSLISDDFLAVCTCVVHKRCHQLVVTVCPRMKKSPKEQVAAANTIKTAETLSFSCHQTSDETKENTFWAEMISE